MQLLLLISSISEEGGQALDEIVIVGSRTAPRSNTTSDLPMDIYVTEKIYDIYSRLL